MGFCVVGVVRTARGTSPAAGCQKSNIGCGVTLCALLFVTCGTVSVRVDRTAFPGGNHDTKSGWTSRGGGLPTTESCITSEIHATRITDRTHFHCLTGVTPHDPTYYLVLR